MRKFRFKLQTVLELRQAEEDRLLTELGALRREEAAEIDRLRQLRTQLRAACDAMEDAVAKNAPVVELARCDEYAKAKRDDVKVQELTLEGVRARAEAKRVELVEAMKDRQVLESLKNKQEREHILVQAGLEQKQLDDLASVRYARRV